MEQCLLSICIPTYNFGEYIGFTLDSIIRQCKDRENIEVIIGDSGSTDNTFKIVKSYTSKYSFIQYFDFKIKSGIDIDMAKTISLSKGKYCWLLSSDDIITDGSINLIKEKIELSPNVIIGNRVICNKKMEPIVKKNYWLKNNKYETFFDFNEHDSLRKYLNSANSIGAIFSYMSVIIFNKKEWDTVNDDKRLNFKNYSHVYNLIKILQLKDSKLLYLPSEIVLFRGFNDSFLENGYIARILIDLIGYQKIRDMFFTRKRERQLFNNIIKKEHPWYYLLRIGVEISNNSEWKTIKSYLIDFSYSKTDIWLIYISKYLTVFVKFLRIMRALFR